MFQDSGKYKEKNITENNKMVGTSSAVLESSKKPCLRDYQQSSFQFSNLTVEDQICFISSEHSYAQGISPVQKEIVASESITNTFTSVPEITINESVCISDNSELSKSEAVICDKDYLDIHSFPNFCSPKSEASSDLGYESIGSPYESELSSIGSFSNLFGDSLAELFPELI